MTNQGRIVRGALPAVLVVLVIGAVVLPVSHAQTGGAGLMQPWEYADLRVQNTRVGVVASEVGLPLTVGETLSAWCTWRTARKSVRVDAEQPEPSETDALIGVFHRLGGAAWDSEVSLLGRIGEQGWELVDYDRELSASTRVHEGRTVPVYTSRRLWQFRRPRQ